MDDAKLSLLYETWNASRTESNLNALFIAVRDLALRMCRRDEDIVQNALIVVHTKLYSYKPQAAAKFGWWVRSVIAHARLGAIRDAGRRREDEFVHGTHDAVPDADTFLDISQLDPYRQSIAADLLAGYSLREIASSLDVLPGTLRQQLRRMRERDDVTKSSASGISS